MMVVASPLASSFPMTKLIALLLLASGCGCLQPASQRSCSELEKDPSVSLAEFYSHCRAHSSVP